MLLEFVAKEKTEHWAIPIIQSVKFSQEISKIAKKFKFDCYTKAYPKWKLDYVPTGKTYQIKTIEDIAELTPEQYEFFIDDLRSYCNFMRETKAINEALWVDIIQSQERWFTWLDTGLHEAKVNATFTNNIS